MILSMDQLQRPISFSLVDSGGRGGFDGGENEGLVGRRTHVTLDTGLIRLYETMSMVFTYFLNPT